MDEIRKAAELVRQEFDDPFALAHRRVVTDGVALFVKMADESYVHARDRQIAISNVLKEHLKHIDWGRDGNAKRLHLRDFPSAADVVIDPGRVGRAGARPVEGASRGSGHALAERRAVRDDRRRVRPVCRRCRGCPPPSGLSSSSTQSGEDQASQLQDAGYVVHRIADHYPNDASDIPDENWIAEGCSRGWVLLSKDKRIRYRAAKLEALQEGHLFCLVRAP